MLSNRFGIHHVTLQAEEGGDRPGGAAGIDPALGLALRYERELDAQSAEVARALREDIGPQLTALRSVAASFDSRLAAAEPSLAPLASVLLRQTDELLESLRRLIGRVRPDALSCGGLPEALRALVADWRLRCPGSRFELLLEPVDDARFGLGAVAVESAALQLASMVIDSAIAARANDVVLAASITDGWLLLQIDHDGANADGNERLASLRSRFDALGGELRRDGSGVRGHSVIGRLPWAAASDQAPGAGGRPL
jgi:glucose-6-phosphate-specific signal transduction histidine kinase